MNEVWNLDVIYRGFDDPDFAADMEKLEKLVQDYVAFAGELDKQTPLDGPEKRRRPGRIPVGAFREAGGIRFSAPVGQHPGRGSRLPTGTR